MADFNSDFWHWYIVVLTTLSIIACFWLLHWMTAGFEKSDDEVEDTGHVWDGDLTELNNPLPRWWLGLFYITLFFSIIYLLLYPGMGKFQGYLNWSSAESYNQEMAQAEATTGPLFARYRQQEIATLAQDKDALRIGERLFANYCSTCHGSDARGARGFPNLRDEDWLWGGQPESIEASILDGRQGAMPAWGLPLGGEAGVAEVAEYVLSFSGRSTIDLLAEKGKKRYDIFCVACHGSEGQGNLALGAPRLSDNIWLYGGSISRIALSISEGRNGKMPAHRDFLGEDKVHLIAAYIYSLSNPTQ
jgi:cytochrome c oxidase cbb3-type subunit 3